MPYMDHDVRARVAELVEEIETSSFRETKWGRRGYSEREVDDFLDYLVDVLFALLSSASTPGFAGVDSEPEVLPLEETELHVPASDETEPVAPLDAAPEADLEPDQDEEQAPGPETAEEAGADAVAAGEDTVVVATVDAMAHGETAPEAAEAVAAQPATGAEVGQTPLPPWVGPDG